MGADSNILPRSPSFGGPFPQFAPYVRSENVGRPFNGIAGEPLWATRYNRAPPLRPPASSFSSSNDSSNGGVSAGSSLSQLSVSCIATCSLCGSLEGVTSGGGSSSIIHRPCAKDRVIARFNEHGGSSYIIEISGGETSVPHRRVIARVLSCMCATAGALPPSPAQCARSRSTSSVTPPSSRAGGAGKASQTPPPTLPHRLRLFAYIDGRTNHVAAAMLAWRQAAAPAALPPPPSPERAARPPPPAQREQQRAERAAASTLLDEGVGTMHLQRAWVAPRVAAAGCDDMLLAKLVEAVQLAHVCSVPAAVCGACAASEGGDDFDEGGGEFGDVSGGGHHR